MRLRLLLLHCLLGAATVVVPAASAATTAPPRQTPDWRHEMLQRVNALRVARGLVALRPCPRLDVAAQRYSVTMLRGVFVNHVGLNGSTAGGRIRAAGYRYRVHGENIARGPRTVAAVVHAWFHSPGHRHNLLYPSFRHAGFGLATGDPARGEIYWSQSFGAGGNCR